MSKPIPVFLTAMQARALRGRRGRLRWGAREVCGTVEVTPLGESRYGVVLVDLEAGWQPRRGYAEVRLTAEMLARLVWEA